jgi:hypothetical protein
LIYFRGEPSGVIISHLETLREGFSFSLANRNLIKNNSKKNGKN